MLDGDKEVIDYIESKWREMVVTTNRQKCSMDCWVATYAAVTGMGASSADAAMVANRAYSEFCKTFTM